MRSCREFLDAIYVIFVVGCVVIIAGRFFTETEPTVVVNGAEPTGLVASSTTDQPDRKVQTIDPGVHLFPPVDFPAKLAMWIKEHPEHNVCAITVHADGYLVVTKVDPRWLNDVLPGAKPPQEKPQEIPPMGMSRPDQE